MRACFAIFYDFCEHARVVPPTCRAVYMPLKLPKRPSRDSRATSARRTNDPSDVRATHARRGRDARATHPGPRAAHPRRRATHARPARRTRDARATHARRTRDALLTQSAPMALQAARWSGRRRAVLALFTSGGVSALSCAGTGGAHRRSAADSVAERGSTGWYLFFLPLPSAAPLPPLHYFLTVPPSLLCPTALLPPVSSLLPPPSGAPFIPHITLSFWSRIQGGRRRSCEFHCE